MPTRFPLSLALLVAFCCLSLVGCQNFAQQRTHYAKLSSVPADVKFSKNLKGKISYDAYKKHLVFKGAMTEGERDELLKLSKDIQYTAAVVALYHKTQTNKKMAVFKGLPPEATEDTQKKPKPKKLAEESPEKRKKPVAGFSEKQKATYPVKKRVSRQLTAKEESKDFVEVVAAQIARKLGKGLPATNGKDSTLLVKPFTTMGGKQTMLSNLLAEELSVQLSNNQWGGSSLRILSIPTDGRLIHNQLDGIITGSLTRMGKEIKVNARLVSADTHTIISAISTKIPATETALSLLETEIPSQRFFLSEDDMDTRLDSLAWQLEQILHDLLGDQEGLQKLCILDFRTLGGKRNLLGRFLAEECVVRLSKNKLWKFVPNARVEELLGKEVSTVSDLTATELTEKLAVGTGIRVIIDGTVTDFGNAVKVNVRVGDTREGLTWGTASVEIPRDKRVEYLLSKEDGWVLTPSGAVNEGMVKQDMETAYAEQKEEVRVSSRLREEFFLKEDFSDPGAINRLPEWGQYLVIISEGGKRFLASKEPKFLNIGKVVNFPRNFSLEFEVKGSSVYWNTLKFADVSGIEFALDFQFNEDNCYLVLPGPKSIRIRVNTGSVNRFKLTRKEGFYEVYINNNLALAGPYSKFDTFTSFAIIARLDQVRFTSFLGKAING